MFVGAYLRNYASGKRSNTIGALKGLQPKLLKSLELVGRIGRNAHKGRA